jgi:hypothetical protein
VNITVSGLTIRRCASLPLGEPAPSDGQEEPQRSGGAVLVTFSGPGGPNASSPISPVMELHDVILVQSLAQRWTSGLLAGGALAVMVDVNTTVASMVFVMQGCVVEQSALLSSGEQGSSDPEPVPRPLCTVLTSLVLGGGGGSSC